MRLLDDHQFTEQQIELAQALMHQATLAAQLTRLAEEARQAVMLEERNRFAREIHDTLAQSFTGILMQLQATQRITLTDPTAAQVHLGSTLKPESWHSAL